MEAEPGAWGWIWPPVWAGVTPPGAEWLRQGGGLTPSRTSGSETLYLTGW